METVRKSGRLIEQGGEKVTQEEPMAKRGRRDGPGAAGSGGPVDPFTTLIHDPKAVDDAWYVAQMKELEPYAASAEKVQAEVDAIQADPKNAPFLTMVRGLNFDVARKNVEDILDGNARENARGQVTRLSALVSQLNNLLSDEPGRLAREIRNLDRAALKARPGLNYWKQHPVLTRTPAVEFPLLKEQIEYIVEQVKARFNTPRLRSEDERDFGFNVDRSVPPAPRQVGFDVFNYDKE